MKVAFVSGASGGIGLEICRALIKSEYVVIGQYNSNENSLLNLKIELKEKGEFLHTVKCDFSKANCVEECMDNLLKKYKKIDLVVNNAGIDLYKLFDMTDNEEWDRVMNVNLKSAFIVTKKAVKEMIWAKSGSIIFISSVWGQVGASMESVYSASKSALIGVSVSLAKELEPSNVRVNCICPGVIDTAMNKNFSFSEMQDIILDIPFKRIGSSKEVADLVAFLVSDKAKSITGEVITLDGGYTL